MRRWFLSYHSPDQTLAERLKAAIERKDPGSRVFFGATSLRAGGYWQPVLAKEIDEADAFVLLIGEKGLGSWQTLEYYAAHDKHVNSPEFPVVLVLLDGHPAPGLPFLRQLHWIVSADPASENTAARLVDAAAGTDTRPGELWRYTSPYRGLSAMEEKDADYFFGRGRETLEVLRVLAAEGDRLPVLLGNSGVGKSSLAQAGVLAAFMRQAWPDTGEVAGAWPQAFDESRGWCVLTLKPGVEPVRALVEPFLRTWQFDAADPARAKLQSSWISNLLDGAVTLRDLLDATELRYRDELHQTAPPAFLLYIDQGEELYVRAEQRQRQRFSEILAHALPDPRLRAMMSMRADFFGDLQKDEALFAAHRLVNVPPLREAQLREVVSRPAELLSARFETPGLVDIITRRTAQDSVKEVGALPLLSYTLDDMWTRMVRQGDGTLRLPAQSFELGGVLVDRANMFLATHTGAETALRRILTLRCATVREDGEPTRRRAARAEFSPEEWRLVSELADYPNRLLVTATTEAGDTYAEAAHEAIFRRWDKLREWIAAEREFLAWRSGFETARRVWQAAPERSRNDALLMGLALAQAHSWLVKRAEDLPMIDREFIDQSMRREALERRQRESLRRRVFGAAIAALIVVSALALFSVLQWRQAVTLQQAAQQERDRAEHAVATFFLRFLSSAAGLADLDQAIKLDPTDPTNYFLRAVDFLQKKDQDGAIADLSRVIELDPRFAVAYVIRGSIYASKKDDARAVADLDQALRLDPKNAFAYHARGSLYYEKQDYDRAISDYDQAIRLIPRDADDYNARGNAYYHKNDYQQAIADYSQAIAINPGFTDAYYDRGNAYFDQKDYDHAIADYDQAVALNPSFSFAYNNRGNAHYEKGNYEHAIESYDQVIRLNPNDPDAYVKRVVAVIKGNVVRAMAEYDEAIRRQPENAYLYFFRGFIRLYTSSTSSAIDDLATAVRLAPSSHYAAIWFYIARTRAGQDAATELADNAGKLDRTTWPWPLVGVFLGSIDSENVRLAARSSNDPDTQRTQVCEADYYIGVHQQLKGARNDAQRSWQSVTEGCSNMQAGFGYLARLELERLR